MFFSLAPHSFAYSFAWARLAPGNPFHRRNSIFFSIIIYANKTYSFTLSERIPGGVLEMRTVTRGNGTAPPIEDVLSFEGADE